MLDAIGEDDDPESARRRRMHPNGRRRLDRRCPGALVLLVGTFFVFRAYVDRQWYVGEADGKVAVFQGIPANPLGLSLSNVDTTTEIDAADRRSPCEVYRDLPARHQRREP